jgi:hypothetical protein
MKTKTLLWCIIPVAFASCWEPDCPRTDAGPEGDSGTLSGLVLTDVSKSEVTLDEFRDRPTRWASNGSSVVVIASAGPTYCDPSILGLPSLLAFSKVVALVSEQDGSVQGQLFFISPQDNKPYVEYKVTAIERAVDKVVVAGEPLDIEDGKEMATLEVIGPQTDDYDALLQEAKALGGLHAG